MNNARFRVYDKLFAVIFIVLSILFVLSGFLNENLFQWAFARHQNQLSWYIRPLFLVPFCYSAYKHSLSGISGTIFLLLTSMCWFAVPAAVDSRVNEFLQMEKDYLTGNWGLSKILITLLVPITLTVLAMSLWKRSLWIGISTLIFIALAKMLWSVVFGGTSGTKVILPALIGLMICVAMLWLGFKRLERKKHKE